MDVGDRYGALLPGDGAVAGRQGEQRADGADDQGDGDGGQGRLGLGLQIGGSKADPYFTHGGGSNAGFEGDFIAYELPGSLSTRAAVTLYRIDEPDAIPQEMSSRSASVRVSR